ncbi:MAG TPA: hypothetical protein DEQ38_04550 [Elusimicrobia bacterium]|nr:MAG: hypothetical protein A2089_00515 [Elusimicrobia bacterium GWD2_63_28]HCC47371.1 hypothetical protein [Elusimicrobiota bacterium]
MPRQARIDIEGQYYHVMSRGIERRAIFVGESDYEDFYGRLAEWLRRSGGKCLAWCLMPNHFHVFLMRGDRPLSELMSHVLTGYATTYNLKHERAGHLFQNRYKSIICLSEKYLRELVPYIHLNPLRAGLVKELSGLKDYRWCGHAAALGLCGKDILDRRELLKHFGETEQGAVRNYLREIAAREAAGRLEREELPEAPEQTSPDQETQDGWLVSAPVPVDKAILQAQSRDTVLALAERISGVERGNIFGLTRARAVSYARAIYCYLRKESSGVSGEELAEELRISRSGVSRLILRGRGYFGDWEKLNNSTTSPNV